MCKRQEPWPGNAREQVEGAIRKLHENRFVFGDLRAPNVLFSKGKVFLIDFDWAGKIGEARYPLASRHTWIGQRVQRTWRGNLSKLPMIWTCLGSSSPPSNDPLRFYII